MTQPSPEEQPNPSWTIRLQMFIQPNMDRATPARVSTMYKEGLPPPREDNVF